jgi:hypothetical protein
MPFTPNPFRNSPWTIMWHQCIIDGRRTALTGCEESLLLFLFLLEHQEHTVADGESAKDVDRPHSDGDASQDASGTANGGADHHDASQNDDARQTVAGTHEGTEEGGFWQIITEHTETGIKLANGFGVARDWSTLQESTRNEVRTHQQPK